MVARETSGPVSHHYGPDVHHRRSIRIKGYDYATRAAYFITICTQDSLSLLATIDTEAARLSDAGRMVQAA